MEAVAIIGGIVALLFGAGILLRGGLLGGCLLVLLAGICFSYEFFTTAAGPLPMTIDRVLFVVLGIQFLLWCRWHWQERQPMGMPEYVLLAFFAVLALRTFTADWQFNSAEPVMRLIVYYLMPLGVYWAARQAQLSRRASLVVFGALALFGVYLAVTTIAETYQVWWLVYPKYIFATTASTKLEFIGRGRGPLLNPVGNGILLVACLGGMLMLWPRLSRPIQLGLMGFAALLAMAIFCTYTRSVWMGGMLALAIVVGLALPRSWRITVLGSGLVVGVLVAATHWEQIVAFKRDRDLSAAQTEESVHLRPILAVVTWNMFLDRPLLGCGFSQYPREKNYYLADRSSGLPLEKARPYIPHNVLFSLLTETGLIGCGLFVALLGLWSRDAWRLWRLTTAPLWVRQQGLLFLAVLAAYLINGMFHDVSVIPMANMLLFFFAGLTAGLRPHLPPKAVPATVEAPGLRRLPAGA